MKIELTNQESETYFYNALCNGLHYISDYGLELTYGNIDYIVKYCRKDVQSSIRLAMNLAHEKLDEIIN